MQWRATCSQVGNHTPGRVFIRPISRSSIAMRSARPDWNGCMQTVEITADVILLAERRPPDVADSLRIGDALRRRIGAEPIEIEVHRVVDDVVHRQVHEAIAAALVVLVVGPLVG